jgi:hypothetical protein
MAKMPAPPDFAIFHPPGFALDRHVHSGKDTAMQSRILSASEQVAGRLRDELFRGRWSGLLPGIHRLSAELGYPRKPVERALLLLESEGGTIAPVPGWR